MPEALKGIVKGVAGMLLAAAAPVAALTTVVAALYDKDVATATRIVSGTTLLSILTMPPVVGFALWVFENP